MHSPRRNLIVPFATSSSPTGFTPQQLRHAYGFDQLSTIGTGQTIAIIVAYGSPTTQADLDTFCAAFSLPSTTVETYYPQGQPDINSGWASETALDVQWAHAIAPGAKIVVVAAKSPFTSDLLGAVDYAVNLGAKQISMSWGGAEFSTEANSDYHFNVPGVTFVASSGDSGAGVSFPASSPFIVSVGGTSLYLDSSANVSFETAWAGSGGGISAYQPMPSYQAGWLSGTQRGVPDVAYDADPYTGVPVYQTGLGWVQYGGTSMSSPQWAAFFALTNSLRAEPISAAPDALYSFANANYAGYFRDIVSGSNGYPAGTGYDLVTGLGSPLANQLVLALAGGSSTQVVPPVFFPPAGIYSNAQNVSLVSATPGAFISYTLDGTIPNASTNGTVYTGPITIGSNTTLNAMAYLAGSSDSAVTGGSYTFLPQAATPTFSPGSSTYTTAPQSVTITTTTSGATIRYTMDGSTPTEANGTIYTGPVSISSTRTLQAIAYASGFTRSPIASATYTINLVPIAAPVFSPAAGTYSSAQTVTLSSSSSGATIRYTTDGSTPTKYYGTVYTNPVFISQPTTLQAIAYATGFLDSPVTSGTFSVNLPPAAAPVFSLAAGTYTDAQVVTLTSATPGATIIYTTDGSMPTETNGTVYSGTIYSGPISINRTTVLKAIAFGNGTGDSPVTAALYTLTNAPAIILNTLYNFTLANNGGISPMSALVQGSDGNFYGTTYGGGSGNQGTVFVMTPTGVLTTLVSFNGTNGSNPQAGLIQGSDGNLYGTTTYGGSGNKGTIFKMTPAGVLTTLLSFTGTNGSYPVAALVQGSDGNFYGTTLSGGSSSKGTVFKMTPAGVLTTLVSFVDTNPVYPSAALVQGSDGSFYGTTQGGGSDNQGMVFGITPAGVLTTLVSFKSNGTGGGDANGGRPTTGLVQGLDGNFYGTTSNGGASGRWGTAFKMTPAGALTTLLSFDLFTNGARSNGLVLGNDGNFYGTTTAGIRANNGTIFKMTAAGVLTTLAEFNKANGDSPSSLIQGSDGNFYGTTLNGGSSGKGVLFQLTLPPPRAASPVFNPGSGTYTSEQSVSITSPTSGATIRYTTDGSTPSETNGTIYDGSPVAISTTTTLLAIAYETGFSDSPVTSALYTINLPPAAAPVFSPDSGTYTSAQLVTITTATTGATIRYTTDGSMPSETNGTIYIGSPVEISTTTTLQAIAYKTGFSDSLVSSASFTILPEAAAPVFSPDPGSYSTAQSVTITSASNGTTIRYTTDGSTPTETNGTIYAGSPVVINTTTNLQAIAYGNGFGDSLVSSGTYSIILPASAPVFSPGTGTYFAVQSVTITSATSGATIRYTTDGSTPTEANGTVYSGPFTISNPTTLKAIAYTTGFADSAVSTVTLTVKAAPIITTQPLSQTVTKGDMVTFNVAASGSSPLNYRWKFNGKAISGATSSTYTIPSVQTSNAGNYTVTVSNSRGSITSAVAKLTVNVPPTISLQPASQAIKSGTKVTFTTAATGTAPLSYQWLFNDTPIGGATASSYSIAAVQPSNAGNYSVVVTNVAGSATSSVAKLTVK